MHKYVFGKKRPEVREETSLIPDSQAGVVLRNMVHPKGPHKGDETGKVRAAFAFVFACCVACPLALLCHSHQVMLVVADGADDGGQRELHR